MVVDCVLFRDNARLFIVRDIIGADGIFVVDAPTDFCVLENYSKNVLFYSSISATDV